MKYTTILLRIITTINGLFADKTRADFEAVAAHFNASYSEPQIAALVAVGMILRFFHLVPAPSKGSRGAITIVGLLIRFLQHYDRFDVRSGPNPLDEWVGQGLATLEKEA